MSLGTILLILLFVVLLASIPVFPYSREWGYAPMGGVGALLLVVVILIAIGVIPISIDGTGGEAINIDLPNITVTEDAG